MDTLLGLPAPLLIAHRGGARLAPENTLAAFERAVEEHGAVMLEMDLNLTVDEALVVCHDPTVDRCTDGTGAVAELTLAELRELDAGHRFSPDGDQTHPYRGRGVRIPTLDEVLQRFPTLPLNLEVKPEDPEASRRLAVELRRHGAVDRVCVGSQHDEVGERLCRDLPEALHFFPRMALTELVMAVKGGRELPPLGPWHVLDLPFEWEGMRVVDPPLVGMAAAHGLWINVWTVDDPAHMTELLDLGVGGIMTDRPDLLAGVLGAH